MEENKGCGCGCGCEEEMEAELLVFENEDGKEETFEVIGVFEVEEKEYIERHTDKQDRRNTFVKLTTKGEEQQKAWMKSFEDFSEAIFARLGDEKSNQLLEDLEAFVKASKEEMKAREEAKK